MTVIQLASTALPAELPMAADPNHVLGESLDNGLGELPRSYTAREFDKSRAGKRRSSRARNRQRARQRQPRRDRQDRQRVRWLK